MARRYPFQLPLSLPTFTSLLFPATLKENQIWNNLPTVLQSKFTKNNTLGLSITRKDLNSIDDKTYSKIKTILQNYR